MTALLRGGTDISSVDNWGRSPLQLAQSKLKLLAGTASNKTGTTHSIVNEITAIVTMMKEYLDKRGEFN